jgi:hypothetical protein
MKLTSVALLFLTLSLLGCTKQQIEYALRAIVEPEAYGQRGSGASGLEQLYNQVDTVDSTNVVPADRGAPVESPTACDPNDTDGDPYDDVCSTATAPRNN